MGNAYDTLVERYGEDAAKQMMRDRAAKSPRNAKGTGGFAHMSKTDPERLKQIGQKHGRKRKV